MISAHLPAGTKIEFLPGPAPELDLPLIGGQVYTLRDYMTYPTGGNVGVRLVEVRNVVLHGVEWGFALSRFRVVQLPKLPESITCLLNVDTPREVERV